MNSEILCNFIKTAQFMGADHVELLISTQKNISANTRLTKPEKITKSNVTNIDIRISIGDKSSIISTNSVADFALDSFAEKAVYITKNSPGDNSKIRPEKRADYSSFKNIEMCDINRPSEDELMNLAAECESIALSKAGITNSEEAEAGYCYSQNALMTSDGFFAEYQKTFFHLHVSVLASRDSDLQTDYAFSNATYFSDLKSPSDIANTAADRTLRKLGSQKIQSCKVPVIFDRRIASQLLNSFISSINGNAIVKGTSFLKNKLHNEIFSKDISIYDRCAVDRGLRSRPFDSDGLACTDLCIINNGRLQSFLLNTICANKLNMESTVHAAGFDDIAPNNVSIANGSETFDELLGHISKGLYVTNTLGNGLNHVTGNYSQGVAGFWIENGEILYPVHEITIAGNFLDMLHNCEIANDLSIETGIDSPSILVEEMIVGGL